MKFFTVLMLALAGSAYARDSINCTSYQAQENGNFKKLYVRLATNPSEMPSSFPSWNFGKIGVLATSYDDFAGTFSSRLPINYVSQSSSDPVSNQTVKDLVMGKLNCPECAPDDTPYKPMAEVEELQGIRDIVIFSYSKDWQKSSESYGTVNGIIELVLEKSGKHLTFLYNKNFTLIGRCE